MVFVDRGISFSLLLHWCFLVYNTMYLIHQKLSIKNLVLRQYNDQGYRLLAFVTAKKLEILQMWFPAEVSNSVLPSS